MRWPSSSLSAASRASRRAAASRSAGLDLRVDGGGPQFGDERGDGEGAAGTARDVLGLDAEFGEEAGGLVAVVGGRLDRGDDEAFAGAGRRHVEEPALLGEEGTVGEGLRKAVAADPVRFEERAAAAQVGPQSLLDTGDDDEPPFEPFGPVRGHQPYGVGAYGPAAEGVGGDVLRVELLEEVQRATAAGTFLGAGGGVEQGADGVEVTIGVAAARSAAQGGPFEPLRPGGTAPQLPEGLLRGPAAREQFAGLAQQQPEPLGAPGVRGIVHGEPLGLGEREREQGVGGGRQPLAPGAFLVPQGAPEPPEVGRVHPAEGGGEKGESGLDIEPGSGRAGVAGPRHPGHG